MLGPEQCTISNISAITMRVGYIKIRFEKEAFVQQLENTGCFMNFWPLLIFKKGYKFLIVKPAVNEKRPISAWLRVVWPIKHAIYWSRIYIFIYCFTCNPKRDLDDLKYWRFSKNPRKKTPKIQKFTPPKRDEGHLRLSRGYKLTLSQFYLSQCKALRIIKMAT